MHEVTGQAAVLERHFDDLDFDVGESNMPVKAVHAFAERSERLGIFRRTKTLGHLIVIAGAQVAWAADTGCPSLSNFWACARTPSATFTHASNQASSSSAALPFNMVPILCSSPISEPPYGAELSMLIKPADQR
jgi:hypothetical protein